MGDFEVLSQDFERATSVGAQGKGVAVGAGIAITARPETISVRIKDLLTEPLLRRHRAIDVGDGTRWIFYGQYKVAKFCHFTDGQCGLHAQKSPKRRSESHEGLLFVERVIRVDAIAAPVHGASAHHAAQALCGHDTLHGMKVGKCVVALHANSRYRIVLDATARVSKVPAETVEVRKDVTARAGRVSVTGVACVIE